MRVNPVQNGGQISVTGSPAAVGLLTAVAIGVTLAAVSIGSHAGPPIAAVGVAIAAIALVLE